MPSLSCEKGSPKGEFAVQIKLRWLQIRCPKLFVSHISQICLGCLWFLDTRIWSPSIWLGGPMDGRGWEFGVADVGCNGDKNCWCQICQESSKLITTFVPAIVETSQSFSKNKLLPFTMVLIFLFHFGVVKHSMTQRWSIIISSSEIVVSRPVTVRFTKEFAAFSLLHFHFSKISTETNPVTWDNLPGISLFQKSMLRSQNLRSRRCAPARRSSHSLQWCHENRVHSLNLIFKWPTRA